MRGRDLYTQILGMRLPWPMREGDLDIRSAAQRDPVVIAAGAAGNRP